MSEKKNVGKNKEEKPSKDTMIKVIFSILLIALAVFIAYKISIPTRYTATLTEINITRSIMTIESKTPVNVYVKSDNCFFLYVDNNKIECSTKIITTKSGSCTAEFYVDTVVNETAVIYVNRNKNGSVSIKLFSEEPFSIMVELTTSGKFLYSILILLVGLILWFLGLLLIEFEFN